MEKILNMSISYNSDYTKNKLKQNIRKKIE